MLNKNTGQTKSKSIKTAPVASPVVETNQSKTRYQNVVDPIEPVPTDAAMSAGASWALPVARSGKRKRSGKKTSSKSRRPFKDNASPINDGPRAPTRDIIDGFLGSAAGLQLTETFVGLEGGGSRPRTVVVERIALVALGARRVVAALALERRARIGRHAVVAHRRVAVAFAPESRSPPRQSRRRKKRREKIRVTHLPPTAKSEMA